MVVNSLVQQKMRGDGGGSGKASAASACSLKGWCGAGASPIGSSKGCLARGGNLRKLLVTLVGKGCRNTTVRDYPSDFCFIRAGPLMNTDKLMWNYL